MKKLEQLVIKTLLLCTIFSTMALVGCSSEDPSGKENGEVIKLTTNVSTKKISSVAYQIPENQSVGVFIQENASASTTLYQQNLLYKSDKSGNLVGSNQHYPTNGNGVNISAYHPYSASTTDNYTFNVKNDQVADVGRHESDLLFCSEFAQSPTKEFVTLQFKHKLSLIIYKLTSESGNPDLAETEVSAVNVATAIGFNRKTGVLGTASNKGDILCGSADGVIVPQSIAAGTKLLKIKLKTGKELYYETPNVLTFESGKQYTFNLQIHNNGQVGISGGVKVEDWGTGNEMNTSKLRSDIKLGAYFFGAWYTGSPHLKTSWVNLIELAPERKSVLGWENCGTPEKVSKQIDVAKENGISFFCFDWYQRGTEDHKKHPTNRAIEFFKQVNHGRMQYCILAVNDHAGGTYQYTPEVWNVAKKYWVEELAKPRPDYLKVDGKPLIIFYIGQALAFTLGGKTTDGKADYKGLKPYLDGLRADVKAAGGSDILIALSSSDLGGIYYSGADILTEYNVHREAYKSAGYTDPSQYKPVKLDSRYLYQGDSNYSNYVVNTWKQYSHLKNIKYIPVATTGWNQRTLTDARKNHPYFEFSEDQVYNSVSQMVNWLDQHNGQGYTPREKIGFIYAWNEYNEGAWLLPTINNFNPANGVRRALMIK